MNTLVRAALPGWGWVPAVWRRRATWGTVLRFGLLGPLVGGAPYVIYVFPIPFAYAIGGPPALVAGWVFATWYHRPGRVPGWGWRALMGALAGLAAALASAIVFVLLAKQPTWSIVSIVALHGVPAATLLALLQRPAGARRAAPPSRGRCATAGAVMMLPDRSLPGRGHLALQLPRRAQRAGATRP